MWLPSLSACVKKSKPNTTQVLDEENSLKEHLVQVDGIQTKQVSKDHPTYLFHYFSRENAQAGSSFSWTPDEAREFVELKTKDAHAKNEQGDFESKVNFEGAGMYFAEDPFSTYKFGNSLLVMKARPGWSVYIDPGARHEQLIKSKAGVISYFYLSLISRSALVVREPDFVQPELVFGLTLPPQREVLDYKKPSKDLNEMSINELIAAHVDQIANINSLADEFVLADILDEWTKVSQDEMVKAIRSSYPEYKDKIATFKKKYGDEYLAKYEDHVNKTIELTSVLYVMRNKLNGGFSSLRL